MGCDIHLHTEVKINNTWLHYSTPWVSRNYSLFAKMAGVRNYDDLVPISEPKGLPQAEFPSTLTQFEAERWFGDGHSHSWLSAQEILELSEWIKEQEWGTKPFYFDETFGFLFGNTYPGFTKYPEGKPEGLQDIRFVFWFDN
ncbi:hypothetical protein LCGC14_2490340 [marine sediment metagenome]|uniref:Uncharacterized protein n=1 Tax=marine sediment metagenome TaxID=412755 RepID=A0A0F9DGS3_9ZZZZ